MTFILALSNILFTLFSMFAFLNYNWWYLLNDNFFFGMFKNIRLLNFICIIGFLISILGIFLWANHSFKLTKHQKAALMEELLYQF